MHVTSGDLAWMMLTGDRGRDLISNLSVIVFFSGQSTSGFVLFNSITSQVFFLVFFFVCDNVRCRDFSDVSRVVNLSFDMPSRTVGGKIIYRQSGASCLILFGSSRKRKEKIATDSLEIDGGGGVSGQKYVNLNTLNVK